MVDCLIFQSEISEVKRESLTLREKLKIQRENAASSLNKTQQEYHEKSAQLRAKIQEMADKLNEVRCQILAKMNMTVLSYNYRRILQCWKQSKKYPRYRWKMRDF